MMFTDIDILITSAVAGLMGAGVTSKPDVSKARLHT